MADGSIVYKDITGSIHSVGAKGSRNRKLQWLVFLAYQNGK
jgi:hypothetical protein